MSTLKDTITQDMKNAMRAKDTQRLGAIRLLLAACKQKEVDERIALDDVAVIAIIDKLVKQRKDSIAAYEAANRHDLAAQEKTELDVLECYLPARLSREEITAEVALLMSHVSAELGRALVSSDMGKIMVIAKSQFAGKADMAQVSHQIKLALG